MHASSDSGLLWSSIGASASGRFWIGQTVWPVLASCRTMWRWLKVPRSVSCPVRRSGRALGEQRGERERLGVRPVDAAVGARLGGQRLAPALELFDELGVHGEALGHAQQLLAELAQARGGHGGLDVGAGRAVELVLAGAVLVAVLGGRGDLRLQPLVQEREVVPHLLGLALDLLLGDDAFGDEAVGPQLRRRASCS